MNTIVKEKKVTDIKNVSSRASLIFIALLVVILLSSSVSIYAGWKSGDFDKQLFQPIRKTADTFNKAINRMIQSPTNNDSYYQKSYLPESTASAESSININNDVNSNKAVTPTQVTQHQFVYPTYTPYPTIVPGQPGSKEWEEQFQKNWNDMQKKIDENQKNVEESQRQFCIDHPTLCH
jgi:hypothetical protein